MIGLIGYTCRCRIEEMVGTWGLKLMGESLLTTTNGVRERRIGQDSLFDMEGIVTKGDSNVKAPFS